MALLPHDTQAPPATHGVLSRLIPEREDDDRRIAQALWEHFFQRLVQQARQRFDPVACRMTRADDVAMEAFIIICGRLVCGDGADREERLTERYPQANLWRVLARMTARLALTGNVPHDGPTAVFRGASAGGDTTRVDQTLAPLVGQAAPPAFIAAVSGLLGRLRDPSLRTVALRRIRGLTVAEIASECGNSIRTVERKLAVIAALWSAPEDSA